MEVQVNKVNECQLELSIEVPVERWTEILGDAYSEYRTSVKIDGFRRGKVPLGLVKKLYGPAIEAEAAEKAVETFYREALDKEDIHAIAPGEIKDVDLGNDKPFKFKAVVEVMPVLDIKGIDSMSTYLEEVTVDSSDLESGLNIIRENNAKIIPHDEPISENCIVITDIQEVDISGVPILTHKWNDISLEIGKNMFGLEADEMLMGKTPGEKVIIEVPAPENESLSDKKAIRYSVEIKSVNRKELPELNDEFAQKVDSNYKNMNGLRDGMLSVMTKNANSRAKVKMFSRLVDYLIENNRVDVPPSMIDWYLDKMLEDAKQQGRNIDEVKFRENYLKSATRNMKWHLIRKHLIDINDLKATEEDFNKEVEEISNQGGGDPEILKTHFKQEKHRARLNDDIEERKVLDFLESKAKITPKKVAYKDFVGEAR